MLNFIWIVITDVEGRRGQLKDEDHLTLRDISGQTGKSKTPFVKWKSVVKRLLRFSSTKSQTSQGKRITIIPSLLKVRENYE